MAQTKIIFYNKSFQDYRLTPPGGSPVALRTREKYTSTKTGTFTIARDGTDFVVGAFGGATSAQVNISEPSQPAEACVTNGTYRPIVLKEKGVSANIVPGGVRKGEKLGEYQVQTRDGLPIVKASLTGAVDLGLEIKN